MSHLEKYTILVVDDEPIFIETIANIIEKAGEPYSILHAVVGETAFQIAMSRLPDLIITDWEMPNMTGLELITKLKESPATKHIPVIMCTGMMISSENLMIALETGAVDYIRKPIDEIELLARVRSMLVLIESFKKINQQKEELLEQKNILLESSIAIKDKELTTKTLNSIHHHEMITSISEDLKKVYELSNDENIEKHIRNVINKMNISSSETKWEEFRTYFEKVHSSFFKNLQNYCINLTQNEIRICALLKLNFSTKNISYLTNQSPRSIDVARYRLRKKLNLKQEENLVGFLGRF